MCITTITIAMVAKALAKIFYLLLWIFHVLCSNCEIIYHDN